MKNTENNPNFKNNELVENLYIEYRASMYRIAFGILRNHEDAEDAVQNAFVSIVKTVSRSGTISSVKAKNLAHKIVRNKATDIYRRKSHAHLAYATDYLDSYQQDAMESCLSYYLTMLPEKYKTAFILKYVYGYTNVEASAILNISQEAFRKRVFRAKLELKSICEKERLM